MKIQRFRPTALGKVLAHLPLTLCAGTKACKSLQVRVADLSVRRKKGRVQSSRFSNAVYPFGLIWYSMKSL